MLIYKPLLLRLLLGFLILLFTRYNYIVIIKFETLFGIVWSLIYLLQLSL